MLLVERQNMFKPPAIAHNKNVKPATVPFFI